MVTYSCLEKGCLTKSVKANTAMSKGVMGDGSFTFKVFQY